VCTNDRMLVSFGTGPLPKHQSFPRKRESTRQTFGNALSTDWIPPAERDGNDRRFERYPIPNDTNSQKRGAHIHDVLAPPTLFLGQLRPSHLNRLDTPWGQPTAATTSAVRVPPVKAERVPHLSLDTAVGPLTSASFPRRKDGKWAFALSPREGRCEKIAFGRRVVGATLVVARGRPEGPPLQRYFFTHSEG
jgi:hypothetical protein